MRSIATTELMEAAQTFMTRGRPVFPLSGQKIPYANCKACRGKVDEAHREICECLRNGKLCHGFYAATKDPARFEGWMDEHSDCTLIAVPTGKVTGFFVLEYDPKNGGDKAFAKLMEGREPIETETYKSPSGGLHFLFKMPQFDFGSIHGKLFGLPGQTTSGIDIKATGGYHLVPPSQTETGEYTVVKAMDPQPAPQWLLDAIFDYQSKNKWNDEARLLRQEDKKDFDPEKISDEQKIHVKKTVNHWRERIITAPDGQQNILIYTAARVLFSLCYAGLLDEEDARVYLEEAAEEGNHPQHRTRHVIQSGKNAAEHDPDPVEDALCNDRNVILTFTRDDIGNANRVVFWKGNDIRYDPTRERFFTWAETKWVHARDGRVRNIVEDVHAKIAQTESPFYDDMAIPPSERDKKSPKTYKELLVEWAQTQRYSRKINDTMMTLRGRKLLWCDANDFDVDAYHFNVRNGVVDLRTGELLPHERVFMCSQISNAVDFDANATCPEFERFLSIVQPNPVHRAYLKRLIGYTIIGEFGQDQIFAVHIGPGGNGKGVLLDIIRKMLDEYATPGQRDTFVRKSNSNRIPADLASFEGKRMVLVDELNANQKLDDGALKELTGGSELKVEAKNVNPWTYLPKYVIHFRTNNSPELPADQATLRRFRPVKWTVTPTSAQWDSFSDGHHATPLQYLTSKESSGILNWILEGTREYLREGLRVPEDLQAEAKGMLEEVDPFLHFMAENCHAQPGGRMDGSKLYTQYSDWYKRNGYSGKPDNSRTVYKAIEEGKYKDRWSCGRENGRFFLKDVAMNTLLVK